MLNYNLGLLLLQILHVSDVEVRETKMMGTSPIIIVAVWFSSSASIAFFLDFKLKVFQAHAGGLCPFNVHSFKHSRSTAYVIERVK